MSTTQIFKCLAILTVVVADVSFARSCLRKDITCRYCSDIRICYEGKLDVQVEPCPRARRCNYREMKDCMKELNCQVEVDYEDFIGGQLNSTRVTRNFGDVNDYDEITTLAADVVPTTKTTRPPLSTTSAPTQGPPTRTTPHDITTPPTRVTTVPYPTTTSPPPQITCRIPGTFPYPNNCKMYYRCTLSLKPFFYVCPGASYFNEMSRRCSDIITPFCRSQISGNSSSSNVDPNVKPNVNPNINPNVNPHVNPNVNPHVNPHVNPNVNPNVNPHINPNVNPTVHPIVNPTVHPTVHPTVNPNVHPNVNPNSNPNSNPNNNPNVDPNYPGPCIMPILPTKSSNAAQPFNTSLFSCTERGLFPYPGDCTLYYRCSMTNKARVLKCPQGTYFNELLKKCTVTPTPRCQNQNEYF